MAVKVISVGKELIIAKTFGTGDAVDAYLIAFLLPIFAINVIAGSFNAALIPTFIRIHNIQGKAAAQDLLSSTVYWSLALLIGIAILFALSCRLFLPILASGFSQEKLNLTYHLFFIFLPTLVVCGLSTTWSAILNAREKFVTTALVPGLTPTLIFVSLLLFGQHFGIFVIAFATLIGAAFEATILGVSLRRRGFALKPRRNSSNDATKEVLGQYLPMVAGACLLSCTTLVDQSMAAGLGPGSVAALSYGNRIVAFALGIGSLALGTAVLPYFSEMVALKDLSGLRKTFFTYLKLILWISIPITFALAFFSKNMVAALYEHGSFTNKDTEVVSTIQVYYSLQVPFYLLGILAVRLISSLRANHVLMWGAAISLCADIVLNLLLIPHFGVAGIGLSTSIVYTLSFIFLFLILLRRLRPERFF